MKNLNNMGRTARLQSATTVLVLALFWLMVGGCSSSTDPIGDEEDPLISFSPKTQGLAINLTEDLDFSVSAPDANTLNVNWWRNGIVISNAENYNYVPTAVGVDTLKVQAQADGFARTYFWVINVESLPSTLPPPVMSILAGPGPEPGDVLVTWTKVGASAYPMNEYVVAMSFDGPISAENWSTARELRRVRHQVLQVGYEELFTVADDGMVPGADIWVAVRAVDDLLQMSLLSENGFTNTTTGWWMNGVVRDDRHQLLPGVIVASADPPLSTNTDNGGIFRLGPFRNIDRIVLATNSSNAPISGWYDFQSTELDSISGRDFEIRLIIRHAMDVDCDLYEGQFLNYLRYMSRTRHDPLEPENDQLHKWAAFPLRAYVPDFVNEHGVDYGNAARFAMAFWDSVMGEPYFEETDVLAEAQVVFAFDNSAQHLFGEARLIEPAILDVSLGEVVPEVTEVYVRYNFESVQLVREVALHEFGHILGLLSHSGCIDAQHLMTPGASGNLNHEHPIHPDEQNAIRTIRYLPQSIGMGSYSLSR